MTSKVDRIRRVGDWEKSAYTYYPIAIIGAGESGIAMGCRLRSELGFDQFRIFERKSGLGGTWFTNQYPGIACDVPAILYSYSFNQNPHWTSFFPGGKEIVRYLYDTCEKYQILDKIQLDTSVKSLRWLDDVEEWEIILEHLAPGVGDLSTQERKDLEKEKGPESAVSYTETIHAKIVCSAVGGLVEPKPSLKVPGIESFEGEIVHTARWDPNLNLQGKEVVVIGTGCSGGQVVPQLIKPEYGAKHVTQLMRSPPWAVQAMPPKAREAWNARVPWLCEHIPGFQNTLRKFLFAGLEAEFVSLFTPSEAARQRRQKKAGELLAYMRKMVPEEYHEILTPDYEVFCKRRVVDEGWFRSLREPNVDITTLPLTSVQPRSVTLGPGRHYPPMSKSDSKVPTEKREIPADVIIMANGYETNQWLHPLDVTGRNGRSLYKTWEERGGAQAYLGTAMDGFPNFFIIFGPNTATGHSSVILASENMVNYALRFIEPIINRDVDTYEVKESAERKWTSDLQSELKNSVFQSGGCKSWYVEDNGWNATVYPRTQIDFTLRCMFPRWDHWNAKYTRKGLVKLQLGRILKLFGVLVAVWGVVFTARNGLRSTREVARHFLARGVEGVRGLVARIRV
ncbi:cyclohexanone monooxygenase [Exophiala viscosa]|uniref:Cyclohexanone monooxygenase n=1 Tax=Exophiala viscosa TaxID=2486360 RepID=A0AAN6IIY1_9EURO|nr:cyclohexanone monooxygenase [Exophiala viscosa]